MPGSNRSSYSVRALVFCTLWTLQFISHIQAQAPACTATAICAPAQGDVWTQDSLGTVIWNPDQTAPFDKYEKVDLYIMNEGNNTQSFFLQGDVDLSLGMTAARLETALFPETLPVNRSCHVLFIRQGNSLDGTHQTLNSSSFFMIRTKQTINGTLVPIVPTSPATSTTLATSTQISTATTTTTSTAANTTSSIVGAPPTNVPPTNKSSNVLSPLVIGLISAGCAALLIAIVALGLLYRTRRRYNNDTSDFKSLHDQPYSPTDGGPSQAPSLFKSESVHDTNSNRPYSAGASVVEGSFVAGRSSSNTTRSGDAVLRAAPGLLSYSTSSINNSNNRQSRNTTSTSPVPLLERKGPNLQHVIEPTSTAAAATGGRDTSLDSGTRPSIEPVLTPGDAQLIAETFRKSMRRPRWDAEEEEEDEEEQDESRRAANELLRKELSEEGVDVQRGVQRRVTIKDRRPHRSSVAPPLTQTGTEQSDS
ncbi:hypothetical protein BGZ83_010242 [Gryganskiella cystojenkinii]|nr:hypothetical protein BGZ83_010242 [Gryganskiella cystojenkinii]